MSLRVRMTALFLLVVLPVALQAWAPAPLPRPVRHEDEVARDVREARRLLVKLYGEDAKELKEAKVFCLIRVLVDDGGRKHGRTFAVAADRVFFGEDDDVRCHVGF